MPENKNAKRKKANEKSLVSNSSILILSGFLIGTVSQQVAGPSAQMYVLLGGTIGLVAYLGLACLARQRAQRASLQACRQASSQLETRVDRHIPHRPPQRNNRRFQPSRHSERQYLTVVQSFRNPYG